MKYYEFFSIIEKDLKCNFIASAITLAPASTCHDV